MYLPSEGLMFLFRATFIQFEKPSLKFGSAPDFNKTSKCSYLLFDAATCNGAHPNKWTLLAALELSFKNLKIKLFLEYQIKMSTFLTIIINKNGLLS